MNRDRAVRGPTLSPASFGGAGVRSGEPKFAENPPALMAEERRWSYVQLDVFARRPLEGNPLAVFPDARGLSDEEMQAIAREMNLSETTFVLRRAEREERLRGVRTRIFTVREELPFAGHPTLGTAWHLRETRGGDEVILELNVGRVPVRFTSRDGRWYGEMVQPDPRWGASHSPEAVAAALGVGASDLDRSAPIETVSTGNPFAIVPFRSLDTLRRLRPAPEPMETYLRTTDAKFFYLVTRETERPGVRLHARMIYYGGEDPATGSAAGPAGAWMLRHAWTRPDERIEIEQGLEIARPSQIFVRVGGTPEAPRDVRVGGHCFGPIRGELTLPGPTGESEARPPSPRPRHGSEPPAPRRGTQGSARKGRRR